MQTRTGGKKKYSLLSSALTFMKMYRGGGGALLEDPGQATGGIACVSLKGLISKLDWLSLHLLFPCVSCPHLHPCSKLPGRAATFPCPLHRCKQPKEDSDPVISLELVQPEAKLGSAPLSLVGRCRPRGAAPMLSSPLVGSSVLSPLESLGRKHSEPLTLSC